MSETAYKGIGEQLRHARELRELSFDEIYSELKIHPDFLKAMEEERFEELPGKAYIKPFLRTYSGYLGINISETIDADPDMEVAAAKEMPPVIKKGSNWKRRVQVLLLYLSSIGIIFAIGLKSDLLDEYKFGSEKVIPAEKTPPASASVKFLLEIMAFDSLTAVVTCLNDTLFSNAMHRGDVSRFADWETYDLTLYPLGNGRIYANGFPLYFPLLSGDTLRITLDEMNYQPYIDTLFLGEALNETNTEN